MYLSRELMQMLLDPSNPCDLPRFRWIEHPPCDGLPRCIHLQVDHLNGILFIDRMEKRTYAEIKRVAC